MGAAPVVDVVEGKDGTCRMMIEEPDLYDYLRRECPDLIAAKKWIRKWANDWVQKMPWDKEPVYTSRAMAAHVSNVLEGKPAPTDGGWTIYFATKYGSELYFAAWGWDEQIDG